MNTKHFEKMIKEIRKMENSTVKFLMILQKVLKTTEEEDLFMFLKIF